MQEELIKQEQEETISAVCTALGEGAIGIIRVSGEKALAVGEQIFKAASGKKLAAYAPNTLVYGHVLDTDGSVVDEVMAVYMKAPHSYTAEDVVEIQCHGGVRSLQKILTLSYAAGVRPAEPGEFTKRAFLNGRIDLVQAEAVMDIIKSRSDAALKVAVRQQEGQLSKQVCGLRRELLDVIVNLEAVIDYPEDDIEEITFGNVLTEVNKTVGGVNKLLENAHTGKILREGLKVAIIGKPNVGKSSFLNFLLKEDRAIVSEFAGTTRDVIEEQFLLGGVPLVLADTAGIRDTEDYVERIGVEKSRRILSEAELAIVVLDGSQPLADEDREILELVKGRRYVIIINKSDLGSADVKTDLPEAFKTAPVIELSAKTGEGFETFTEWLQKFVYGDDRHLGDGIYVQNARHERLLQNALTSMNDALAAAEAHLPYDCIMIDLRNAAEYLGEITGDAVRDEIINEIFSKFCIGK